MGALVIASMLTAALPAFGTGFPDAPRTVGVLVVAAAWAFAWAFGALRFERRHLWWLAGLGATAASLLVTSLLADQPVAQLLGGFGTRMGAVYWLAIIVIAAGASAARYDRRLRTWIAGIYVWAVPTALVGLSQALSHQPVTAGLVNDNHFALAMLLVLPPSIGLALTSRKPAERMTWLAVAAVLALAVVTSGARAATAALVAESGLALAVLAPSAASGRRRLLRGAGLGLAGLATAAILVVAALGAAGPQAAPSAVARALGPTFTTRAYIWTGALRTFSRSPLVGFGPDGYRFASQRFIQPGLMAIERGGSFVDTTPADPHSSPLRLFVGMGLLGAAAVGLAIWGWLVTVRRASPPSEEARALRDSFAIAAGGFALASLFAPWAVTIGALPAMAIGLAAAGFGRDQQLAEAPAPARWAAALALASLFLALAVSVLGQSAMFAQAVDAATPAQRQTALDSARGWAPYSFEARFDALWSQGANVSTGEGDARAFQKAVDADALVRGYSPALAEFARMSLLEAERAGRTDLTWERATLERAAALGPGIPDAFAEQLHLALVSGDKAAIAQALQAAQGLAEPDPNYPAYLSAAQAALATK